MKQTMRLTCKQCESKYTGQGREEILGYVERRCFRNQCSLLDEGPKLMSAVNTEWIRSMQNQVKSKKQRRKEAAALLRKKMEEKRETPIEETMMLEFDSPVEQHVYL